MSTSSPTTGNFSAVWTALPNGSNTAPSAGEISVVPPSCSCTQTFSSGTTTTSANAPSRFTPMPLVRMHSCRRPARQLRHIPQTTCPSPETLSPIRTSRTASPRAMTSP
jgi:hypothetical protein